VNAARKAVHRSGPDVSMEEIAAFAGTSKSIIYRYFEDKNGLQIAVGETVVAEIRDALEQAFDSSDSLRSGLEAMIATYLEMIEHSPNVYYFVTRTGSIIGTDAGPRVTGDGRPPLTTFIDSINAMTSTRYASGLRLDPAAADTLAAGSMAFVRGAGERWLAHRADPDATDRRALAAQVTAWLWDGLASAPRPATPEPATPEPATSERETR
jgi:AcrR family transcriptional regulator